MKICLIKAGSAIVTQENDMLNLNAIQSLCSQIVLINELGWKVVLVSSGAVACGSGLLNIKNTQKGNIIEENAIKAGIGQSKLIYYYSTMINTNSSNLDVGQILVTRESVSDRENYLKIKSVILGMLDNNIIPVINENDALGLQNIRFSDNDHLAAIISIMVNAKLSILLSEVGYIYTKNPKIYDDAIPLSEINVEDIDHIHIDDNISSNGGMKTKLDYFFTMDIFKCGCIMVGNSEINNLIHIVDGSMNIGTKLISNNKVTISGLKKWIATSTLPKGIVLVSPLGANVMAGKTKKNIRSNLYCIGISRYFGQFDKGDIVSVRDEKFRLIGIGKTKYSSIDLKNESCENVFIHDNEFFAMDKYPFVDLDREYVKGFVKKTKKKLIYNDNIITIKGLKKYHNNYEKHINRSDISDLINLSTYVKKEIKISFDEWVIYSYMERII